MNKTGSRIILSTLFLFVMLFYVSPSPLAAQVNVYVDDDAPGDPGPGDPLLSDPLEDGSTAHPYDAIQEGIDAAVNGDTVLVADGLYTGIGNQDMSFLGKAITVASAGGPAACIIDGEGSWSNEHCAFMLNSDEGPDSVLQGFTITQFLNYNCAAGISCIGSSPTIIGNVLRNNEGLDHGGAMDIYGSSPSSESSPLITGNVFTGNLAGYCSGILISGYARPLIFNNLLYDNDSYNAGYSGDTGAIYCGSGNLGTCLPLIVGCSIVDNHGDGDASGIWVAEYAHATVIDSIVRGNQNGQISGFATVTYSNVEGISITGIIDADPLFTTGPHGDYYLSQVAAGQAADSPCLDTGSDLAEIVCAAGPAGDICFGDLSTRSDGYLDSGQADMGFHYPGPGTVAATFGCVPASGTLPFQSTMFVELENRCPGATRRIAGKINVMLAGGQGYSNWRAGFTNVGPGDSYLTSWVQNIPALGSLEGDNLFTLVAEDVTPSPWNQPPYPPAGDTDANACTLTGVAP